MKVLSIALTITLVGLAVLYSKSSDYLYPANGNIRFPEIDGFYYLPIDAIERKFVEDKDGIQMVAYDHPIGRQYNSTTIANLVLTLVGVRLQEEAREKIRRHLDFLVDHAVRSTNGNYLFPFYFDLKEKGELAPWYSAYTQGRVASAMLWGFRIFGDRRYLVAAEKAVLVLSEADNSYRFRKVLEKGVWLKKYPNSSVSNLDGTLTALAGLIDVYRSLPNDSANRRVIGGLIDAAFTGLESNVGVFKSEFWGHYFSDNLVLGSPKTQHENIALLYYLAKFNQDLRAIAISYSTSSESRVLAMFAVAYVICVERVLKPLRFLENVGVS